ncbi:glycosyltransferase [Aquibium sp. A9E412]|uniref:glycosyltransferase n=1 Tax=Aquibium sp. A9E412 TaxID=2976767 RepID=UPI0025AED0CD|nr:glycosyltransferase [Aquibium sp. A9E412]MDN2565998.1 glycosyltransferase [Aquibium sp. A9E412]
MNSAASELAAIYARHPRIALRHLRRALTLLARPNGRARLAAALRHRLALHAGPAAGGPAPDATRAALARLSDARAARPQAIVEALLPHAGGNPVIAAIADPALKAEVLQRYLMRRHGLLDEAFYRARHLAGDRAADAAGHYFRQGWRAGLSPNAVFDPRAYLAANPEVADTGIDPALHYALIGWRSGRAAGPGFDAVHYLAANPDVRAAGASPLVHYLAVGRGEGRAPLPLGGAAYPGARRSGRSTILIVGHDAELGGAQQVMRTFGRWLRDRTGYDVRFVVMRGGAFLDRFAALAPTLDLSTLPPGEAAAGLAAFAGDDVRCVLLNSVASAGFLRHWGEDAAPVVAYLHEMGETLERHAHRLERVKARAATILCGSDAVADALAGRFAVPRAMLARVHDFLDEAPSQETPDRAAARRALGLPPEALLVVGCGVAHWRKAPEVFVEVAARVLAGATQDVHFVWIGDGPDRQACEARAQTLGIADRLRFVGYRPDIDGHLRASDLFLLTSAEDPFPLVALHAARAGLPIVCFAEAGGMPELVGRGCGSVVPFGDVAAMAAAVRGYLGDARRRQREGACGRALVEADHTVRTAGPQLLHHLRRAAGLKPEVSVVVPNYDCAAFLPERLRTLEEQTFQDFEVVLLDDASTDGSVALLRAWAERRPGTRLVVNAENGGSPGAQWLRGMRLADADLVWVAEADDACDPAFLETALAPFCDRNVFLSHVRSVPVDAAGRPLGDYGQLYLDRIAPGRWDGDHRVTDAEEVSAGLGIANVIPNASAVVFRRFEPEPAFARRLAGLRLCGDWLFYLRAMRGGLVAYSSRPLNFHRRHAATVTRRLEGSQRYFDEIATVRGEIVRHYRLGPRARERARAFLEQDLDRFGIVDTARRAAILAAALPPGRPERPAVLFVAPDLAPGGGQTFMIRLANAWARHGGRAVLLDVGHAPAHPRVEALVDPAVALFRAADPGVGLAALVERFDIDLVHSAIWWADRYVADALAGGQAVPWVVTMHGCHETHLADPALDPSFARRMPAMLERVDAWVRTAGKNARVFERFGYPARLSAIDNGVAAPHAAPLTRAALGLRDDALVLVLAARAIPEKGWRQAVEIARRLEADGTKTDLMLIGEGPEAEALRARPPKHVHLFGQVEDLQPYLQAADIGLLPSRFVGESMPLVALEMMACGLPVVASEVGEVAAMLGAGETAAGVAVPLSGGAVDVDGFVAAVRALGDPARRRAVGRNAQRRHAERFTVEAMLERYGALYRDVLGRDG